MPERFDVDAFVDENILPGPHDLIVVKPIT